MANHNSFLHKIHTPLAAYQDVSGDFIHSSLDQYHKQVQSSPLSIKYVSQGTEIYQLNNQHYSVGSHQYLIVNHQDDFLLDIDTPTPTSGICLYPSTHLINQVAAAYTLPQHQLLEPTHRHTPFLFTQRKTPTVSTETGQFLDQHIPRILTHSNTLTQIDFNNFYIALAQHLVKDQLLVNKQLKLLPSTKKQTKEELYRRIALTKDYIHDNYKEKITIEELAQLACLSKYHFLRSFKQLFQQTPYQYLLQLKLQSAQQYLQKGYSFTQTSQLIGFSDSKNLRKAIRAHTF